MRRDLWICGLLLLGVGGTVAVGQRGSDPARGADAATGSAKGRRSPVKRNSDRRPMALTPAREAAALTFVDLHHPELAKLIKRLKKRKKPTAYKRAVRQIYRDSERLARIKERLPRERYELQLRLWKLDSRIRLLAAHVFAPRRPNRKLKAQLEEALLERVDLQIEQMELDRRRFAERLDKLNASVTKLKQDRQAAANRRLKRVKRSLGIRRPRKKKTRRPVNGKTPKRNRSTEAGK
ncbi:MAG: hypothetical protein ACE5KM_19755 [Planctomycetaceae bacterium]